MPQQTFDLIVIGGGPGGIEAALYAAGKNLSVAIISNTKIGGRAVWGSLVPSKVWLAAADRFSSLSSLKEYGLSNSSKFSPVLDLDGLRKKITASSQATSEQHLKKLTEAGVSIFMGKAILHGNNSIMVKENEGNEFLLESTSIIIASGSGPRFTPQIKPNKDRIIAPKIAPGISEIPQSLVMAGGGVTGTEYAYAFAALGTKVTILQSGSQLLPRLDKDVSDLFERQLTAEYPISIVTGAKVESMTQEGGRVITITEDGKQYTSDYGFIAIGRKADISYLDDRFEQPELTAQGTIKINQFCQTNLKGIYAIGDVSGTPMTANRATMQARIAVEHIINGDATNIYEEAFIEAVYSVPAVAQIGNMTPDESSNFKTFNYNDLLKAKIHGISSGVLKLKISKASGLILGAAGFGKEMADLMSIIQLAINNNLTLKDLQKVPMAHPSYSELISSL